MVLHFCETNSLMKYVIFFLLVFIIPAAAVAQYDAQTSILTNHGLMTVSKTVNGHDMISLDIKTWDQWMTGTKYMAEYFNNNKEKICCIEIADKYNGACRSGIGFQCGIYDCPASSNASFNKVNNQNRICTVMIKRINHSVIIVFIDEVDWENLQTLNDCHEKNN